MKIALCEEIKFPIAKRQDGFIFLKPENRYTLITEVKITNPTTDVIEYNGSFFKRENEKFNNLPIYSKSEFEKIV